jgi:hypothetical protein
MEAQMSEATQPYDPRAMVFEALRAADRPLNYLQVMKIFRGGNGVHRIPLGTVSGSLHRLVAEGAVEKVKVKGEMTQFRTVKATINPRVRTMAQPMRKGVHRKREGSKTTRVEGLPKIEYNVTLPERGTKVGGIVAHLRTMKVGGSVFLKGYSSSLATSVGRTAWGKAAGVVATRREKGGVRLWRMK